MGQPTDPAERVGRQRAAHPIRVDDLDDVVGPGRHHPPSAGTGLASPVSWHAGGRRGAAACSSRAAGFPSRRGMVILLLARDVGPYGALPAWTAVTQLGPLRSAAGPLGARPRAEPGVPAPRGRARRSVPI